MRNVLIGLSVLLWAVVIWYAWDQAMPRAKYGIVFFGGILELFILTELMDLAGGGRDELLTDLKRAYGPGNRIEAGLLTLSAIDVAITCVYLFTNFHALYVTRQGRAFQHELYMAAVFTLVIIYLTWRSFGGTFLAVILLGIGYGRWGMLAPGPLAHSGIGWERLMRILVISIDGFFGFLTQLVAAWIALFLLYAGFLKAYGAFDLIMRLAFRSARYIDSGIAQTAVLSSAIIGSVNGSQTANAGMTGSFTIPLMKRNGIKAETAGAIEAVASTSGQVLPPVMGAGAFIMANLITGITYADVIVAGLIPAAVLVVTIFMAVHYVSVPQLDDTDPETLIQDPMPQMEFATEVVKYGVPLAILIYKLGIQQVTVMTAALWTAVAMLLTGTLIPLIQAAIGTDGESMEESARRSVWETLDGAREGVVVLAPVAIILGAINGVVDILGATGVPTSLSLTLMQLSGGVLLIAAILAMIICIILGLGMPTTASYTVVALLIAPTLINQFLLPELAGHFFVFYAAILAGLTPPIATCVAVACGISGGNFWKTCVEAIKISAPLFILPFAFVYHPEIVSTAFNTQVFTSGAFALLGAIAMIHGINYTFGFERAIAIPVRITFTVTGVLAMVHPSRTVQLIALAIAIALFVVQSAVGKPKPIALLRSLFGFGSTGRTRPKAGDADSE
ncbi:TRAP transporter fused permease subunit (plasmid) [Natrinema zhouii]|uniref:TRAP transporter permease n=1 Tax=Natrinema zhouii TaxID=1710539 RepID=UPI001CFFDA66|nr:TRAP transporter fused permease subunit [Natrinema zhouii]UHQ98812.1 TRAP transporter fused permease subunit [Natrinema zhouii]